MDQAQDWPRTRVAMALVGAAGGVATWGLVEILTEVIANARLLLFLSISVLGFFVVLLSLAGPNSLRRGALPALGLAVCVALLVIWASLRFSEVETFLQSGLTPAALFMIYLVATPFLSVRLEHGRAHWLDYAHLFQTAWGLIVRGIAAALFTSVFWGVLFLSDALLDLVNINLIEDILDIDIMPYAITGTVTGLALAVAHEWRAYVSPHLLLRLFRLLVPLVVPVLMLFIIAVGFSGLEGTLTFFSETALLTAVAIGGITLVTVSVDRDAAHQVQTPLMVWMVRILAVLLMPVALLALWGIGVRVLQYGWTPQRVLAALCVFQIAAYGVIYAVVVFWRGDWMRRLRRANVGLALMSLLISVLWLTPVLNAERISANAQLKRILEGKTDPEGAAIWEMHRDWGKAGKHALYTLRQAKYFPNHDAILVLIDRAENADSSWEYKRETVAETTADTARALHALVPVFPAGQSLPVTAFDKLSKYQIGRILDGCQMALDDGSAGCLFLMIEFRPGQAKPEGLLLYKTAENRVEGFTYGLLNDNLIPTGSLRDIATQQRVFWPVSVLSDIRSGQYEIAPAPVNVLNLRGNAIFPEN